MDLEIRIRKIGIHSFMTKIIVSGCSFSDQEYKYYIGNEEKGVYDPEAPDWLIGYPYPIWPEIVADEYGLELINCSTSGSGNDQIIDDAIKSVIEHPDAKIMLIGLTQWFRVSIGPYKFNFEFLNKRWTNLPDESITKWTLRAFEGEVTYDNLPRRKLVERTLSSIYKLIQICKLKNIRLYIFQLLESFNRPRHYAFRKGMLNDIHFSAIEGHLDDPDINLIGWPFNPVLGGFNTLDEIKYFESPWQISETDAHPNEIGMEKIAEQVIKNLKKVNFYV